MLKLMNLLFLLNTIFFLFSCTEKNEIGSKSNPLKFYLIPAQDMKGLSENGEILQRYLSKELNMNVVVDLPVSYVAVVEAFGSKRADVAIINTLGYILAAEKYQVEPRLKLVNRGRDEYFGQILIRSDSKIKNIKDLNGKKFAFVDPASTSGYLLPLRLLKNEKVKIKEYIFAGRHDSVVAAVYQKQVDAGATFYTPPDENGTEKDARMLLKTQYPDVFKKVKILQMTGSIPNDPLIFRKDLPEDLKIKIVKAVRKYIKTEEGAKVFLSTYHITDFKEAKDSDYDKVREYLKDIGENAKTFVK